MDRVSRRTFLQVAGSGAIVAGVQAGLGSTALHAQTKAASSDWAMNATLIEACSCGMFCPCYFGTVPSAHGHGSMAEHFCRFNMAYRVNSGHLGNVSLNGLKLWIAGDLGADFSKGANWAEITFEPSATKEQRAAITTIVPHVYPVTWKAFTLGKDAAIDWVATKERAAASLDGGKAAHIILRRNPGMTQEPVVISNLRYFGAPRNTGFVLMPNEIETYRVGANPFEYKGTNGFMITYDITAKDVKTVPAQAV
jgi:hypothetical protein